MKNSLFIILLFQLIFIQIHGQGTVLGSLNDDSNQPLEFANVLLLNAQDSTLYRGFISDHEGKYSFENVANGQYFIQASLIGSGEASSDIFYIENNTINVPLLVLTAGVELEDIVVTAKKPFIEMKADKVLVNVANSSVSAGNTALEVLQKSPGVVLDNNQSISLRGKQGVLVMINGKNQYLSGDEIVRMLENMPASNIENIELITNPSAKYDAEGDGGIINIVLKKNENLGTNCTLSSTLRQGMRFSNLHNIHINSRTEKINIFGKIGYQNYGWRSVMDLNRKINYNEGLTEFSQTTEENERGNSGDMRIGLDWNVTPNTIIGVMYNGNIDLENAKMFNNTFISGDNKPNYDNLCTKSNESEFLNTHTANINFSQKLNDKGAKLTFDVDKTWYKISENLLYNNAFLDLDKKAVLDPFLLKNNRSNQIDIFASSLDFSSPISSNFQLESGLKFSSVQTDNETFFEKETIDGISSPLLDRNNAFNYTEDVYAAYVNGAGSIASINIQAGLRVEHTQSRGVSPTTGDDIRRKYTDLFPSLSISKAFQDKHQVGLSYSRRLQRPNYQNLNPFESYLDQFTFNRGNPFLNPEYTHALSLNYAFKNAFFLSLDASQTKDGILEYIIQENATNKTYQTNINFKNQHSYAASIMIPKIWTDWWTTRTSYSCFYNDFYIPVGPNNTVQTSSIGHHININNDIQLSKKTQLEIGGFWQSKLNWGQITVLPRSSIDFGISTKLLKDKARLKISVTDILRMRQGPAYIDNSSIYLYIKNKKDTRRVSVNFTYNFGNDKVKRERNRQTSSHEANRRL